jgi:hypothetical protein
MKKGRFTVLEEDSTVYPHTCLFPKIYMGIVTAEWATWCLPWVTIETIKDVFNLLKKTQLLAATS